MKIKIEINTDNTAFEDNPTELADILRMLADDIEPTPTHEAAIRDSNGNTVGYLTVTK